MNASTLVERRLSRPFFENTALHRVQESCVSIRDRRAHNIRRAVTLRRDGARQRSTFFSPISAAASVLREGGQDTQHSA